LNSMGGTHLKFGAGLEWQRERGRLG